VCLVCVFSVCLVCVCLVCVFMLGLGLGLGLGSRLAVNRGSRLDFTPRPTLFFLPAGFCCLVSSIEETPSARLSKLENYGFDQLVSQRD